ncbi:fibronectin type III domain-containing protein [Arthrobacter crystallopoietes]|uniref:fibronectin type III domain-containing protein n=1 Tax=Crystallibacter crystallopoietes TaxID=37928 RepID=UPI003D1B4A1D
MQTQSPDQQPRRQRRQLTQLRQRSQRRARTAMVALTAAGLTATGMLAAGSATAAVPTFPNNVVVFPDRDFVSIEGYAEHVGNTATVEVTRPGIGVVGSAKSVVSGTDVAFEINHPGGVCWGADTTHKVTPDIKAGDVVSITFPDGTKDETTVADTNVSKDMTLNGSTITVEGRVGAGVNTAQMEQRIINPDMGDTAIGRRDVRALPGPLVPSDKGGYSSSLEFPTADTFLATYVFDDPAVAEVAAAADLGERAMSWQQEDADGNRQGLTIAEYGELGGPGMGGCPAGPSEQAAPAAGTAAVVYSTDRTSMKVNWTPATAQPGAAAVTGYSVLGMYSTSTAGQQGVVGMRTDAAATSTTLTGLDPARTYTVEVRSIAGARMSEALTITDATAPDTGGVTPPSDTTAPTLALSPAPAADTVTTASSVDVTGDGQNYYTTDGSPVISGGLPSDTAQLVTGPIAITEAITLKVAAFDQAGNFSLVEGQYAPEAASTAPPAAPAGLAATAGQGSVTLRWDAGDASVTGYQVSVYNADGAALAANVQQPAETTARTQTVSGLTSGTAYQFSVKAKTAAGGFGAESAKVTATPTAVTDRITIGTARFKAGDEFRITGTGSQVGTTVTVYTSKADGTIGTAIPGANAAVVAAAPPGIGDYSIRLRNGSVPATNPGRIFVKSSGGGVAGPFTVTNR